MPCFFRSLILTSSDTLAKSCWNSRVFVRSCRSYSFPPLLEVERELTWFSSQMVINLSNALPGTSGAALERYTKPSAQNESKRMWSMSFNAFW